MRAKLRTNVPGASTAIVPQDKVVQRFNRLNSQIVHGLPEVARAYDALARHVPLLRQCRRYSHNVPNDREVFDDLNQAPAVTSIAPGSNFRDGWLLLAFVNAGFEVL
jgi:hypothetical protein